MGVLLGLFVCTSVLSISFAADPDAGKTPAEIIISHGYPLQEFWVTTPDGYILLVYRIPHGRDGDYMTMTEPRPPVLLNHGLGSSMADFINNGPERSLAFFMSNNGYDVWLMNSRGNSFSRNHTTLSPDRDARKFFNFSWHEVGYYDIPACIDLILKKTGQAKTYYIGHSQGGTSFLVMGATRPDYNKKIRLASLMAPSAYLRNVQLELKLISKFWPLGLRLMHTLGIYEAFGRAEPLLHVALKALCEQGSPTRLICIMIASGAVDWTQVDFDKAGTIFTNSPSNVPLNEGIHYAQIISTGNFQYYDYGVKENLKIYKQKRPPPYDIKKVTAPVGIYYGPADTIVAPKDCRYLVSVLPNVAANYTVPYRRFDHIDFVLAKDAYKLVYQNIVDLMKKY